MESKGSLGVADQSLALHRTLIRDKDNPAVADQIPIQGMALRLRRTPMALHLHNTVPHLISRVAQVMDMHPRSKRLDQ